MYLSRCKCRLTGNTALFVHRHIYGAALDVFVSSLKSSVTVRRSAARGLVENRESNNQVQLVDKCFMTHVFCGPSWTTFAVISFQRFAQPCTRAQLMTVAVTSKLFRTTAHGRLQFLFYLSNRSQEKHRLIHDSGAVCFSFDSCGYPLRMVSRTIERCFSRRLRAYCALC